MSELQATSGCPLCSASTSLLHAVDAGMRLRLEKEGQHVTHEAVCASCFKDLSKKLSNASYLAAEQTIKENYRKNLWKSRLSLIKQARNHIILKNHAEAAVCYEKYMRIIELAFEKKRTDIRPEFFKDNPREVTLIVGALWALVEIYDLHPNYSKKQEECATKLGEMVSYTNLFTSIIKKATAKKAVSKNPRAYKMLLKAANVKTGNCFIASIAFESRNDPTLIILRAFRNQILSTHFLGKSFIRFYYRWSPGLANRLQHYKWIKTALRAILPPFALCLKRVFSLNVDRTS
jgi:hypothetical protein